MLETMKVFFNLEERMSQNLRNENKPGSFKPVIAVLVFFMILISGYFFYNETLKEPLIDVPESYSGNLKEMIVGIPATFKSDFTEIRDTFSVDESNHAIQAWWEPMGKNYEADFIWFDSEGEEIYRTTMNMKSDWKRTFVHYRGPEPMKAGKWTIAISVGGEYLGKTNFNVVRDVSKVPLKAQLSEFNSEKLTLNEAHFLVEKIKCFVDGDCEKEALFDEIPPKLADRKVSLAILVFRDGEIEDIAISSSNNLKESLKSVNNLKVDPEKNATVELAIIHSGIKVPFKNRAIALNLKKKMGFSLSVANNQATLLPMDIARKDINEATDLLRQLSVDAGLSEEGWKSNGAELTAFMTQDFALTEKGGETKEYAYSRSIVPVENVTREDLVKSVDRAFNWYMKNQLEDGRYMYTYFPNKDDEPNDDWGLRNLNGIWVLAEIAKDRNNPEMIKSVKRAIDVFRGSLVEKDGIKYVDWKKHRPVSSIAGTAFLLGAMGELYEPEYDTDMKMMADAIISLQEENGKLRTDFYRPLRDIDQMFYPGETLLILMRYYKLKKYKPALEAVEKAFPFYREFWNDRKNQDGPFVPWQARAYHEAWEVTKKQEYANFVFTLTDWLIKRYKPLGREAGHGRAGAFDTQFASTAVYSEGMAQAYDLALALDDKERIETYGRVLKGNLGYLLGLQFKKDDVYWIKRPGKAIGATGMRPDWNELRLDATYHAISAIHYTTNLVDDEEWNKIKW
jgi:hypothetical protein